MSDRQAAEAVRARIDWKYALGLRLEDEGFHFSVLSAFRERVVAGGAEQRLLDDMLEQFREQKLLKARGRQRNQTPAFKERYKTRAGVEGTLAQGTRAFGLRRSRYRGLAKTHFLHILTAAAIDLTRVVAHRMGFSTAQPRMSHFAALAFST